MPAQAACVAFSAQLEPRIEAAPRTGTQGCAGTSRVWMCRQAPASPHLAAHRQIWNCTLHLLRRGRQHGPYSGPRGRSFYFGCEYVRCGMVYKPARDQMRPSFWLPLAGGTHPDASDQQAPPSLVAAVVLCAWNVCTSLRFAHHLRYSNSVIQRDDWLC